MAEKITFEFTQAGFFEGDYYNVGDRIRLFPKQAKFETHRLRPATVAKAPPPPATKGKPSKASE